MMQRIQQDNKSNHIFRQNTNTHRPQKTIPKNDGLSQYAGLLFCANRNFILPESAPSSRRPKLSVPKLSHPSTRSPPLSPGSPSSFSAEGISAPNSLSPSQRSESLSTVSVISNQNNERNERQHLLKHRIVTPKTNSFFSWCKFQVKGWFNKEKILAEFANLMSRAGSYAAMGAAVGAYAGAMGGGIAGGVFGLGVGAVPGAAIGAAHGAAIGALAGFVVGLIVSAVSIVMKPIMSCITQWFKNRGANNYKKIIVDIKSSQLSTCEKTQKLSGLLFNCEKKMLEFIYGRWLQNGTSKPYFEMQTILNNCILPKNSILDNILLDLNQELHENLEITPEASTNAGDPHQIQYNAPEHKPKPNSKISLKRTLDSQSQSYNTVRLETAVLGSEVPIVHAVSADLNAAIYFPAVGIASAVIAGKQGGIFSKLRKILTHPVTTFINAAAGVISTVAEFVPVLDVALHGLHGIGIPSMLFSIFIHYVKEKALAQKDAKIKRKILTAGFEPDTNEELISEDFARVVRHEVTKNIPTALNKLVKLVEKSKNFTDTKQELLQDFQSTLSFIKQSVDLLRRYCEYTNIPN